MRGKKRLILLSILFPMIVACTMKLSSEEIDPTPTQQPVPPSAEPSTTPTVSLTPGPGSPGLGDPYFPSLGNGGYDVLSYDITLDVDLSTPLLSGDVVIHARSLQTLSALNFDFLGMDVESVTVEEHPASYDRQGSEITLYPVEPIPYGEEFSVHFVYSGLPGEDLPPDLAQYEIGWNFYPGGVMVAGEPSGGLAWYPVNEHPSDKALYTFTINVAEPFSAAANGILLDVIDHGDTRTFIWESSYPMSSYLVTIAIADFDIETGETAAGVPIRSYFGVGVPQHVRSDFAHIPEIIDYYSSIFGPYPFEAAGVVVHDIDLGFALETQTLVVFGRSFTSEFVVAHELAHMWYGDSVGPATWQDVWLNEGFATYASVLWLEDRFGDETAQEELRGYYAGMALGEPVLELSSGNLTSRLSRYPLTENQVSAADISRALEILFDGRLSDSEWQTVLSAVPSEGMPADEFPSLITGSYSGALHFRLSHIYACLAQLGLADFSADLAFYPPPGDPSPEKLFNRSVYQRGALTLHALRLELGDEIFFEILRAFAGEYAYSSASTADFIALAERLSGRDLYDFFQAWLYDELIPDLPAMGLHRLDFIEG